MNPALDKIRDILAKDIKHLTPVEWAELNLYLPSDVSNYEGYIKYSRTPYLIEPLNTLMPESPIRQIFVMKGSQLGFSVAFIQPGIGWVISQNPCNILFMVNDDEGIKRVMQTQIDPMINNSGIGHLIKATSVRGGRNQKTGDTSNRKQFEGGNLITWSGQSMAKLSQISPRIGFYDEYERYKSSDKKAGAVYPMIINRHKSYLHTYKAFFISSPEVKGNSNIETGYLLGDQRRYHIPCKHCGEKIVLEFSVVVEGLKDRAGIVFKRDKNGLVVKDSVEYVCQKCGGTFKESHKYDMLESLSCEWIPTGVAKDESIRSYQISALYAPLGFYDWYTIAKDWCRIHPLDKPILVEDLKVFINQTLGETWEVKSKEIKTSNIMKNCRNYDINTIPVNLSEQDGNGKIVLITCAVDLNGKMGESVLDDDVRLDYEVVAWTENGDDNFVTSYSIDHGSIGTFERMRDKKNRMFKGDITEYEKFTYRHGLKNSVWDIFKNEILNKEYIGDNGKKYKIGICGIDTGNFTVYANEFVKNNQKCFGLKGKSDNKYTMFDTDKRYFQIGSQPKLYLVEGDRVKDRISESMDQLWEENSKISQPIGFMNFPNPDYNKYTYKTYFHEYEGEKREIHANSEGNPIGMRWVKKHASSPNHFWDTRCYNYVIKEIAKYEYCKSYKVPVSWENFCTILKNKA